MDCKREFTVISIQRLLRPVKWNKLDCIYLIYTDCLESLIEYVRDTKTDNPIALAEVYLAVRNMASTSWRFPTRPTW